jgi:hypothetical protein
MMIDIEYLLLSQRQVARPFVDRINGANIDTIIAGRTKGFIYEASRFMADVLAGSLGDLLVQH